MTANSNPPKWTPPPPTPEVKPVVHRSITLRVDLRALAALGGALIIIGAVLPWVAPQFQPVVRVFGPTTSGGWPIVLLGALAIVLQFWPQFRTVRVSLPAAALGFAAGIMALASALNTIGLGRTLIGEQTISPLTGRRHRRVSHAGRIAYRRVDGSGAHATQSRARARRAAFVESIHCNLWSDGGGVRSGRGAVWIVDRQRWHCRRRHAHAFTARRGYYGNTLDQCAGRSIGERYGKRGDTDAHG